MTMNKNEEFENCMGDPTMPDDASPDYDEWLFSKGYDTRQPEIDALKKNIRTVSEASTRTALYAEMLEKQNAALKAEVLKWQEEARAYSRCLTDEQAEVERLKADAERYRSEMNPPTPRYRRVACSACGGEFGPGDHGFSHCESHQGKRRIG